MKSISKKQFRVLLTLSIAALVASTVAGVLDSWLLPQPLLDYEQAQHGVRPKFGEIVISLLGIPGLITRIVALVGLYRFWPPARLLSVVAWVYMLVWMSVSPGPVLSNTVTGAFSECSTLLVGMVLALIYFSPAAEWFQKKELTHDT